jgi:hypothetical protein
LKTADISSNTFIQQAIVDATTGEVKKYARLEEDGLHIGERNAVSQVVIDENGISIMIGGEAFSKFALDHAQFGNHILRNTADGGLAFVLRRVKSG